MKYSNRLVVMLGAVLAIVLVGGAAWASAQDDPVTYYACVNNSSGTIKVYMQPTPCNNNEMAASWNNVGIQGEQGPPGVIGAYQVLSDPVNVAGNTSDNEVAVSCAPGDIAASGGFSLQDDVEGLQVTGSNPNASPGNVQGWTVTFANFGGDAGYASMLVLCLDITP